MEFFCCDVCNGMWPLDDLLDLDCSCTVCSSCGDEKIRPRMVPVKPAVPSAPAAAAVYTVGELVRYRQRDGTLAMAKVVQIDQSVQPPGYGIELEGAADVRFTEHTRLLPRQLSGDSMQQGFPVVRCPKCEVMLTRSQLSRVVPDALQQLEDALTNAWLEAKGIIRCPTPGCEALIDRLPASSSSCTCSSSSSSSRCSGCSSCKQQHKAMHRYRCPLCSQNFCDFCRASPYHEGLSCRDAAAPCCPFCDARVPEAADLTTGCLNNRQLRDAAANLGADCSWCLERSELVSVYKRAKQVCGSCRPRLADVCTKQLPCGHWCCGVRGTSPCLPCLQPGCESQAAAAGDGTCCFCWEPLQYGVIALSCKGGHFVHISCARKRLQVGCPGPALTFDFLFCPLCGSGSEGRCGNVQVMTAQPHLQHDQLQAAIAKPLELREQVVQLAKQRLKLAGLAKHDQMLQPGGRFDGRPADYAIAKYNFYECHKCHKPYFGGAKECGAAPDAAAAGGPVAFDAQELVCGSCSAVAAGSNCPQHGSQFVEWKCKYCCNIASWFCWGSTYMCSRCHDNPTQRRNHMCPGPGRCALSVPHPATGESCCLGCGVCRHRDG